MSADYSAWEDSITVVATVGTVTRPRRIEVYAPDPLAASFTAQITSVTLESGKGKKVILGRPWLTRIVEGAEGIQHLLDEGG